MYRRMVKKKEFGTDMGGVLQSEGIPPPPEAKTRSGVFSLILSVMLLANARIFRTGRFG